MGNLGNAIPVLPVEGIGRLSMKSEASIDALQQTRSQPSGLHQARINPNSAACQ
jgi:hypothetical protein